MLKNKKWLEETIRSMRYMPWNCGLKVNPHELTNDANELLYIHHKELGTLILEEKKIENGIMIYYYSMPRYKKYI